MDVPCDNINMSVKNYNLKEGMSIKLFDSPTNNHIYQIKGPMGRGLGLTKDTKGQFQAYSAGTGIFVFLDLVARIGLQQMNLLPEDQCLHPDFKLNLYASFESRENAYALEMLENIRDLVEQNNSECFKLKLRFSNEKSPRWDKHFIDEEIREHGEVKKIWVCGPPLMSELFDKYLQQIVPVHEMDFRTQVDIM